MSLNSMISPSSIVVAAKEQVSSKLDEETVILNTKSGVYYGLDSIGTSIWNLIDQPKNIGEIRDYLLSEYDVEPSECDRDLLEILQELRTVGLIEVRDEATT